MTYPPNITFAGLRASGVNTVLIYCRDHHCSHSTTLSADRWRGHVRLPPQPDFVCTACGKRGAEIRPDFPEAQMGAG